MTCPSGLSDEQWAKIAKFFERPDPRGAREKSPKRRVIEACLYRLREDCRWRALPHDFPPHDTVHDHFQRWQKRGVWQEAVAMLNTRWREEQLGRARRAPRHAILDSQSVKTAAEGEARDFHGGKHLLAKEYEKNIKSAERLPPKFSRLTWSMSRLGQPYICPQKSVILSESYEPEDLPTSNSGRGRPNRDVL